MITRTGLQFMGMRRSEEIVHVAAIDQHDGVRGPLQVYARLGLVEFDGPIGALRAPGSFCNQAPEKAYCIADKSVSPARNPAKQACETAVRATSYPKTGMWHSEC